MDKYFARKFILRKNPRISTINEYLTVSFYYNKTPSNRWGENFFERWLQPESLTKMIPPGQDHGFSPGRLTGKVEKRLFKSVAKINKSAISGRQKRKKTVNADKKVIKFFAI